MAFQSFYDNNHTFEHCAQDCATSRGQAKQCQNMLPVVVKLPNFCPEQSLPHASDSIYIRTVKSFHIL